MKRSPYSRFAQQGVKMAGCLGRQRPEQVPMDQVRINQVAQVNPILIPIGLQLHVNQAR